MESYPDNFRAYHPKLEVVQEVENEQPLLLLDLQSVLVMLGE